MIKYFTRNEGTTKSELSRCTLYMYYMRGSKKCIRKRIRLVYKGRVTHGMNACICHAMPYARMMYTQTEKIKSSIISSSSYFT